ncbi:hypothetical protein VTL71DRAFT_6411 [Oculimacula yallundae]|uniref:Uncharacterized protein n=1 Tax=Oculimacula yallundae TaxID=86028 RepID=A0ABR4BWW6_9HELO
MAQWLCLVVLASVTSFAAASDGRGFSQSSANRGNATLFTRDGNNFNQEDLSFITRMAAIGDSYSAGIGAGNKLGTAWDFMNPDGDYSCSRYDHSYPSLVNLDERLGDHTKRKFQFKSCSGAVIRGNDVELTNILNQCIFQWAVLTPIQTLEAKGIIKVDPAYKFLKFLDISVYGRGCEGQMDVSQALIDGSEFSASLDSVISAAKAKLGTGGMIYYTGYAKFWAADLTSACDKVSWGTWLHKAENMWEPYQKLTTSHRRRMNALVDAVNDKLSAAVARAGPNVVFIDYDAYLTKAKGHFCEAGVDETPTSGETWNDNLFFKLDSGVQGSSPWKRDSATDVLTGTFKGYMEVMVQLTIMLDHQSRLLVEDVIHVDDSNSLMNEEKSSSSVGELLVDYFPNFLPDGYGRVFHPQKILHEIIAQVIIKEMGTTNLLSNGFPEITDDLDIASCPYNPSTPSGGGQQMAMASYTNPIGDADAWRRLISYDSNKLSILVANSLNGPDYVVNSGWTTVIEGASKSGKTIIGYVRTGYLSVSTHKFKTRLGSRDLADWTSQIEQDIDMWYTLYPSIGGIFFDEGWPECGPDNIYAKLYTHINAYTKRQHPGAYTVLNPGSPMAQCFEDTMDTLLTFESSYEAYKTAYVENDWVPKDNRKIWHIVYNVTQDKIAEVSALSLARHAGYLEMTNDVNPPNPYDNVPDDAYMAAAMSTMQGGKVRKDAATSVGGSYVAGVDATVIASDYTSVTITWPPVANALGYAVFQNDKLVMEMPAFFTRATVGMLKPGTSGLAFEVKSILSSGSGGVSKPVTAKTTFLPNGNSIINVKYVKNGAQVVYTAEILVPYAAVRLFIAGPHKAVGASKGWPINAGMSIPELLEDTLPRAQHKLVSYMVEGNDFYSPFFSYSGAFVEGGKANADWAWTQLGVAPQFQSGYTYTWTVPIGGTDALLGDWVVQGEGYAPGKTVFGGSLRSYKCDGQPCDENEAYDCKGSSLCTTPGLLGWCDHAVNNLIRTDDPTYGTSSGAKSGGCWGDGTRFCGIILQGARTDCTMSGNDMWKAYQAIRKFGGCSRCGSYHLPTGCLLTINYVSKCDDYSQLSEFSSFRSADNSTTSNSTSENSIVGE